MKNLIVYFSRNHQNYVNGAIVELAVGNTEVIAKKLQKLTGAELFKIEPVQEYAHDYQTCILQAKEDLKRDARPELKAYPESLDTYDTIYLGYPNYWGTMPTNGAGGWVNQDSDGMRQECNEIHYRDTLCHIPQIQPLGSSHQRDDCVLPAAAL